MIKMNVYALLSGEKFSPKELEKTLEITFSDKSEPGDIGNTGRYRGKPVPYGDCTVDLDYDQIIASDNFFVEEIINRKDLLKKLGVENITLQVDIEFDEQCNFELDSTFLKKVGMLDIPLAISCYPNN